MNILVIAAHPDDETLGCGGAICRHVRCGDRVSAVFLTSGELGLKHLPRKKAWATREAEAVKAARILRLNDTHFLRGSDWMLGDEIRKTATRLRRVLRRTRPHLIYLPHPQDGHPDHQAAWPILRAALKGVRLASPALRAYEVWSPLPRYDHVEDITSVMARKLRALRAHKSQLREYDYLRAITALNQYRGILAAKSRFAEVFCHLSAARLPISSRPVNRSPRNKKGVGPGSHAGVEKGSLSNGARSRRVTRGHRRRNVRSSGGLR